MSVINTNITSMIGQSNLSKSQSALQTSMERLSSGLRINSAKDDAAGQAIANRMTAQITGLAQAQRNANDGISIAQTAEGSLNQVNDNLQRIRELTVQAQNGTNSQDDLKSIQEEINQRLSEIDRISEQTAFNGVNVLAKNNDLTIQVGANDNQTITVGLQQINANTLGMSGFSVDGAREVSVGDMVSDFGATGTNNYDVGGTEYRVNIETGAVTNATGEAVFINAGTGALDTNPTATNGTAVLTSTAAAGPTGLASGIAAAGADKAVGDEFSAGGLTFTVKGAAADEHGNGVYTTKIDGVDVDFTIADADTSATVATSSDLYTSVSSGSLTTKDAESNKAATLTDLDLLGAKQTGSTLSLNGTDYTANADGSEVQNAGGKVMFRSYTESGNATLINEDAAALLKSTDDPLKTLDSALQKVDTLRSELGAVQNRFEDAITNLSTNETNLAAARSRIEDADYAVEVANMTRAQILQQAGTSVLAQANQIPQNVLSLLG